ncbi:hypothetical protein [Dinoroseobacter sp. S375]|uniref:hypothetical protein n=1 Tax=Dinoroseobacter sp. S375 TaxID=3415136 RepID=UPI003C7CF82F
MADSTTRLKLCTDDDGALYVATSEGLRVEGVESFAVSSSVDGVTVMELLVSYRQGLDLKLPVQPRADLGKLLEGLADEAND